MIEFFIFDRIQLLGVNEEIFYGREKYPKENCY